MIFVDPKSSTRKGLDHVRNVDEKITLISIIFDKVLLCLKNRFCQDGKIQAATQRGRHITLSSLKAEQRNRKNRFLNHWRHIVG
jgi:hypothetical protein